MAVTAPDPAGRVRLRRAARTPYVLIAPAAVLLGVFLVYPIGMVAYDSLRHDNPAQPWNNGFAGIGNFRQLLFSDPLFWQSLGFTARWVFAGIALQLILGLALALLINESFVGRGLARALVFSPWAVSGVLTTGIWVLLYNPATGLPRYLADLSVIPHGTSPLASITAAFPAALLAELWRGVPFFAILLLAELQSAAPELYEAASIDGASRFRRFRHITLPHLRDAIILSTLLRAVWEFNNVDLLYTLTGGGPADATTTLPLYVADQAVNGHDFGYGSALTMVAFLVLLFGSLLYLRLSKFGGR